MCLVNIDSFSEEIEHVQTATPDIFPVFHVANLNLRSGQPGGRFNLTKYDDKFEQVVGHIYDLDTSQIPKHKIIYTVIEPTDSNRNWTMIHGISLIFNVNVIEVFF